MRSSSPRAQRTPDAGADLRQAGEVLLWTEAVACAFSFGHPRMAFNFRNALLRG
ncbi:hypothetical protein SAMN05421543_11944 [Alicyclobacillus macrosporangiidus]|jgi:hypothetical protein|uniref:Uncharacterized protein n=1 Tax=Alicyclobacillus macrosporangiidus TaxID=392015 RepID=A0A1I7KUL0_9BACL|nr:hypothetical protein SAMN05421543_11944 [Alicyclobacillus macrosporangiidus]